MNISEWTEVSKDEFDLFVQQYPYELKADIARMFDPPVLTYNDFSTKKEWPWAIVCYTTLDGNHYFIKK